MEPFEEFHALVLARPDLQQELLGEPDPERFVELAARMAADLGLDVTAGDVRWALREARRSWHERTLV